VDRYFYIFHISQGVARMETKNTKQRLDDLQELLQAGYLTENEFRVARINALRENGVDIVIHGSRKPEAKYAREEEDDEPRGCGCLSAVVLVIAVAVGAVFFVSSWPDRWGGGYVRAVREWVSAQWSDFFSDTPSSPIPDPVPQRDVSLPAIIVIVSDDEMARPASPDAAPQGIPDVAPQSPPGETSPAPEAPPVLSPALSPALSMDPLAGRVSLPSLDARIFVLPNIETSEVAISEEVTATTQVNQEETAGVPKVEEPNVIVVEIPSNSPTNLSSAPSPGSSSSALVLPRPRSTGEESGKPLRRGVVSARSVRIRSAPDTSTNNNVVGWGSTGDRFSVLEEGSGRDGSKWYRIRYEEGNKQGWISGTLVTLEKE
jgi:hypothetical protein